MNDSKECQDAESVRSGYSHVTNRPVSFPPHPILGGMLSRSFGVPSRREGPPRTWDTHGMSGNVFVNPDASLSAPYPQELNQWSSSIEEPLHSSTVQKSERRIQVEETLQRIMEQTNNDCRFGIFISTIPTHRTHTAHTPTRNNQTETEKEDREKERERKEERQEKATQKTR